MRILLAVTLIFFFTTQVFAQATHKGGLGVTATYFYSGVNNIDIGFSKGKMRTTEEMIGATGFYGGSINLGYGFKENKSLMTTRASFEFHAILFGSRMSLVNYTDLKSDQISFLPELGLTYSGVFSIMYGYNIFMTENRFSLNRHSFSISIMPYWNHK